MTDSDTRLREFSKLLDEIVDDVVERHGSNIDAAVDEVEIRADKLPGSQEFTRTLRRQAFRERVHWQRSSCNKQARSQLGKPRSRPRVITMESEEGASASERRSLYDYFIAGLRLGDVTGAMIPGLISREEATSTTALLHVRVLKECNPLVPSDKTIQEAVKETKLNRIFAKAAKEVGLNQVDEN